MTIRAQSIAIVSHWKQNSELDIDDFSREITPLPLFSVMPGKGLDVRGKILPKKLNFMCLIGY